MSMEFLNDQIGRNVFRNAGIIQKQTTAMTEGDPLRG
jgi:hypothetical protein